MWKKIKQKILEAKAGTPQSPARSGAAGEVEGYAQIKKILKKSVFFANFEFLLHIILVNTFCGEKYG